VNSCGARVCVCSLHRMMVNVMSGGNACGLGRLVTASMGRAILWNVLQHIRQAYS
jgi:hypothetical protein